MTRTTRFGLALGAAILLPALALHAAPPETVAVSTGRMESFDLAKLADGETRIFGEGDRAVTATRKGDEIEITMAKVPEGGERTLRCTLGKDNCQVLTTEKGGAGTMLFVGSSDTKGHGHMMVTAMAGEGDGGGNSDVVIVRKGGEGMNWVEAESSAGSDVKIVRVGHPGHGPGDPDQLLLRCPEGDTNMFLKKDEAAAGYRCPKHDRLLEEVKGAPVMRHVVIERREDGDKK